MMIPEFDQKVFSMKDGELSDPLETQFGYHIIERIGFEEGGNAAFEDVEDNIRDFLRHARRGEMISQYVDDLRSKASIEDDKP
jgi:parvulin-like peptidyl-prolyl isomerase